MIKNKNTIERQIVPETPKVIDNEQINVYVPIASSTNSGFAKFDINDFIIDSNGKVSLKYSLFNMKLDADPLKEASLVKLLNTDFEYTYSNPDSRYSEVKLIRSGLDAKVRPELIMLDVNDFEQRDYDADQIAINPSYNENTGYKYYRVAKRNPYSYATIMKIDPGHFEYNVAGDAKLRVRYPYAVSDGTTYNTNTPANGFGLIRPRLDWFKFNINQGADYGTLYFDQNYLLSYLNNPNTNPYVPEIMPIYGAVRDLQPWPDKDLYYHVDGSLRPIAKRDFDSDLTGSSASNRIRLDLTKDAIGLNKIANKYFSDWSYSDFGPLMKEYFNTQFTNKVDESTWNAMFNDYSKPGTINEWLTNIESQLSHVEQSANIYTKYKGIFTDASYLPTGDNIGEYAYLLSTSTVWAVDELLEWYNTELTLEGWQQNSHTHPADITRFSRVRANTLGIIVNNGGSINDVDGEFKVKLTPDDEDGLDITYMNINIPYVPETQFVHNWQGQPSVDGFTKGKFVRYWVGTRQDLADDFGSIVPDDVIVHITDDYMYIDGDGELFTKEQTEILVGELIGNERYRGWSQGGDLIPDTNYVLRTTDEGGEAKMVPFDMSLDSSDYVKKVLSETIDGALLEDEVNEKYYTINGKRIVTISGTGELGLSNETSNTEETITYKGNELLTKPTANVSNILVYKNGSFSQLTKSNIDTVYSVDVNPLVLPVRSLSAPPSNVTDKTTYNTIVDMILGVDIRAANKMPITTSAQGTNANAMFFAKRSGEWVQFSKSLNINNSQTLIGNNTDVAGSLAKDLYDIDLKADLAKLYSGQAKYLTTGYGYDAYAGSDIIISSGNSMEDLFDEHTGVPVNKRVGDGIIARRIGLTSDNLAGNNRSSFNMRHIICRDEEHRNAIYSAMGVNSDRDNILFMWPEA